MNLGHASTSSVKVVYGKDNRKEVHQASEAQQMVAKSTAAMVSMFGVKVNKDKQSIKISDVIKLSDPMGANVCENEKFADQPTVASCSGFLVGEDLLVTAGHCAVNFGEEVENEETYNCKTNVWVFDFQVEEDNSVNTQNIKLNNTYTCKKVVKGVFKMEQDAAGNVIIGEDYAVIQLDRKVVGREPLKIRKTGRITSSEQVYVVGHPTGLPKKVSDDARILENDNNLFFGATLDTFQGNSGSAVFNAKTHEVEGILVRGQEDYVESSYMGKFCFRSNKCDEKTGKKCLAETEDMKSEHVNRITSVLPYL